MSDRSDNRRAQVQRAVAQFPGLSVAQLAKECHLQPNLVEYHLHRMERAGILNRIEKGYFLEAPTIPLDPVDRRWILHLRRPPQAGVVLELLLGAQTVGEIAVSLEVSPSAVTRQLKALKAAEIVIHPNPKEPRTLGLADPERARRLLRLPTPKSMPEAIVEMIDRLASAT